LEFDLDYTAMRRTCATYFRQNRKGAQRQLRHATPTTTARVLPKTIAPEHRIAVEALDAELCPERTSETCELVLSREQEAQDCGLIN
jgi:hypothetical protein